MKKYTITFTAEFTMIGRGTTMDYDSTKPEEVEEYLRRVTDADDVHVKSVKVFEREVDDDDE